MVWSTPADATIVRPRSRTGHTARAGPLLRPTLRARPASGFHTSTWPLSRPATASVAPPEATPHTDQYFGNNEAISTFWPTIDVRESLAGRGPWAGDDELFDAGLGEPEAGPDSVVGLEDEPLPGGLLGDAVNRRLTIRMPG
ncbi:hypothetical protein DMB66_50740 [Actinoplanes sp. ATCC 53533]|nr:hypothetical protein DMB66_50740 [Actinoplanes sp. ATCC 53533]